jgi:hypothetical protein
MSRDGVSSMLHDYLSQAALDSNKLIQLRDLSTICASRPQQVEPSRSELKYWTHINICKILYYSSVISLNNQRSNETLVGTMIQTSVLQDRGQALYQLRYAASFVVLSYQAKPMYYSYLAE